MEPPITLSPHSNSSDEAAPEAIATTNTPLITLTNRLARTHLSDTPSTSKSQSISLTHKDFERVFGADTVAELWRQAQAEGTIDDLELEEKQELTQSLTIHLFTNPKPVPEETIIQLYTTFVEDESLITWLPKRYIPMIRLTTWAIATMRKGTHEPTPSFSFKPLSISRIPGSTSGVYCAQSRDEAIIFKPGSEEPGRKDHRGYYRTKEQSDGSTKRILETIKEGQGQMRRGVPPGSGPHNELMAYVVTRKWTKRFWRKKGKLNGFIPTTILVSLKKRRPMAGTRGEETVCSVQSFIPADRQSNFSSEIQRMQSKNKVRDIQVIAWSDILLGNTDRHRGNYRICLGRLIPIDHGLVGPSTTSEHRFNWRVWPQAHKPVDHWLKRCITETKPEDIQASFAPFLNKSRQQALRYAWCRAVLCQKAIAADLTFADVATLLMTLKAADGRRYCQFTKMIQNAKPGKSLNNKRFEQQVNKIIVEIKDAIGNAKAAVEGGASKEDVLGAIENHAIKETVAFRLNPQV